MTEKKSKTPFILSSIFLTIAILGGYLFYLWYFEWRFIISTNDAYVEGDVATIAPKVNGYVEKLLANENTYVKKGDLLFELNPSDYDIALKHAQIQVDIQKRALITIDAQMKAAQANLSGATAQIQAAKAALINAQNSFNRLKKLESRDFVSKAQIDNATLQVNKARADLTSTQSQELAAKENLNVLAAKKQEVESQIKALQVLCYKAQKDINDTVIRAPFDGVISNIVAKKGDLVSSGKPLASLIPVKNLYVVANYKETQVKDIEPGTIANVLRCTGEWCYLDFKEAQGWLKQDQLWGVYPGEVID